jgi:adenine-specific DNA-methyltransferase
MTADNIFPSSLEFNYQNKDCLEFLAAIPGRSVDAIVLDPPYYRVCNEKWDKQWRTFDDYSAWCALWIGELGRVAKHSCNFWLFGFPYPLARLLPLIEAAGFNFRQHIVIDKGLQSAAGRTSKALRMFPTVTEHAFVFHYEARDHIRELLQAERRRLGMSACECNLLLRKAANGGGTFSCIASEEKSREHRVYPTRQDWERLRTVMNLPDYEDLVYPFHLPFGHTDVWRGVDFYDGREKKSHPTQKPVALMEQIITAYTREGQTVLDLFAGSGTTAVACKLHKRKFVGCEMDKRYYEESLARIEATEYGKVQGLAQFFEEV